jgi:hypothetical protein
VTFLNAEQTKSYVLERDQKRFAEESRRLLRNTLRLRKEYRQLIKRWRLGYQDMTTEAYWDKKLGLA